MNAKPRNPDDVPLMLVGLTVVGILLMIGGIFGGLAVLLYADPKPKSPCMAVRASLCPESLYGPGAHDTAGQQAARPRP